MKQDKHWLLAVTFACLSLACIGWWLAVVLSSPPPAPLQLFAAATLLAINGLCLIILLGVRRRG